MKSNKFLDFKHVEFFKILLKHLGDKEKFVY